MSDVYEKRGLNYRGVKFRTWLYFTLFSCALLTFMCAMQLIMFRAYYQRMKINVMHDLVVSLEKKHDSSDMLAEIRAAAVLGGMDRIYFFIMNKEQTQVLAYIGSDLRMDAPLSDSDFTLPPPWLHEQFMHAVSMTEGRHSFFYPDLMPDKDKTRRLNYIERGANMEENPSYYFMQTSGSMEDGTTKILLNQLIIAIAISLILSLMLSYVLARHLAQPITKLTKSARHLAKGNYDVKFDVCGYAEIDDLAETLNNATDQIKTADVLRRDLIANISHELRTPLTMIKAYAEMIRDLSGDNPKKREEHLSVIVEETDRLSALVTDILDLSKIQSESDVMDKTLFNLADMVREVAQRFAGMYAPQGYDVKLNILPEAYVIADTKHIGQVVYNLIANALNYVGADKQILVSLTEDGNRFFFRVQDHGKGIDEKDIPHIWDRYFRSAEAKRNKIGSGIGLSIVKGICEAHSLQYGVDSVLGKGSAFYVVFHKVEPSER